MKLFAAESLSQNAVVAGLPTEPPTGDLTVGRFDGVGRPAPSQDRPLLAAERSAAALGSILRRGGFAVELRTTRAVNDVVRAAVAENVSLIRSIPAQHFTAIEGLKMIKR